MAVVLALGVLASIGAGLYLQRQHQEDWQRGFEHDAAELASAIEFETNAAMRQLGVVGSFVAISGRSTQDDFQGELREAELLGEEWVERIALVQPVPASGLRSFVARERRASGRRIDLRLRDARGADHLLIAATVARFGDQIGRDLRGLHVLERRLIATRGNGEPSFFQLKQIDGDALTYAGAGDLLSSDPGLLTGIVPVRSGPSDALIGWLLVQVRPDRIARAARDSDLASHLTLVDTRGDDATYALTRGDIPSDPAATYTRDFSERGLDWSIAVSPRGDAGLSIAALTVLLLGVLGTIGITGLIAQRRRAERFLSRLSESERDRRADSLTGLPNRVGIGEALEEALADEATTAVLFCDLDRFKIINDSLGHQAGDELLVAVADRLRASLREKDVVGRFGGDEFVAICRELESPSDAHRVAERILANVARPLKVAGTDIEVATSVGIAVSTPDEPRSSDELLRDADTAMYAAKKYRSGMRAFDGALHREAKDRLEIEAALRTALKEDLLRLEYQPIVGSVSHRLEALEALARFEHPVLREAGPQKVIPVAEEVGLIGPLGERVLRLACEQMARWNVMRPDAPPLQVSVNVASAQLRDPSFVKTATRALHASGLHAAQLILELPESAVTRDAARSMEAVRALAEIGVGVSIDDFGSGRLSLTDIAVLETITELKIDRSLVSGPASPSVRGLLVSAIAEIGRGLGANLTAVGVETQEQLAAISSAGVGRAQGFLFSRPQRPEELTEIIATPDRSLRPRVAVESPHMSLEGLDL